MEERHNQPTLTTHHQSYMNPFLDPLSFPTQHEPDRWEGERMRVEWEREVEWLGVGLLWGGGGGRKHHPTNPKHPHYTISHPQWRLSG